jgi:hypothetical protein
MIALDREGALASRLLLLSLLFLTSCESVAPTQPPPPPPDAAAPHEPSNAAGLGSPSTNQPPLNGTAVAPFPWLPARDFLVHGATPSPDYGAVGYVLLTHRYSDGSSQKRYLAACHSFIAAMEPVSAYSNFDPSLLMPTFWLLTAEPNQKSCDIWVKQYDFARAVPLLSLVEKMGFNGPVLVAWDTSPENGRVPTHELLLDLSNFSDEDMQRAFGIWIQQLAQDPRNWTLELPLSNRTGRGLKTADKFTG